ncbi:MAG TPA: hypothetical protein DEQ98_02020 [Acidobacteria bacterium]|nr:hypothetical protein [Acidobacteriota bacterium]
MAAHLYGLDGGGQPCETFLHRDSRRGVVHLEPLRRQFRAATLLCEVGWRWVAPAFPVSLHPFQFLLTAGEVLTTGDESIFR